MAPRTLVISLALVALAGCTLNPDSPRANRPRADSPGAICNAWLDAMDEGDFKAVVACLAPEAVKGRATAYAWRALECRDDLESAYSKDKAKPTRDDEARERRMKQFGERIDPVLRNHGLTPWVSDGLKRQGTRMAAREALREKIRDHEGFLVGYLELTHHNQPVWQKEMYPRPRLVDVVIDGNQAEGKLVRDTKRVDNGKERVELKDIIRFVRLPNGDWRVDDWNSGKSLTKFFPEKWRAALHLLPLQLTQRRQHGPAYVVPVRQGVP